MHDRTPLGDKILRHWTTQWPEVVEELRQTNHLDEILHDAQERTGNILYELMSVKKMDYQAAWEIAMEEWATLPNEGHRF
jgi:hypothetical protein